MTRRARADLLAVADYGAERWGFEAAHAFLDSFENAFALLERHPDIGRYRDELGPNARSWLHRGYVILYTHTESDVTIDRILHAAADLPDSHYGRDSAETGQ